GFGRFAKQADSQRRRSANHDRILEALRKTAGRPAPDGRAVCRTARRGNQNQLAFGVPQCNKVQTSSLELSISFPNLSKMVFGYRRHTHLEISLNGKHSMHAPSSPETD